MQVWHKLYEKLKSDDHPINLKLHNNIIKIIVTPHEYKTIQKIYYTIIII